jgi:hypothetical protein
MWFPEVVPLDWRDWVDCASCGGDAELYMLKPDVWPVAEGFGWLCVPCVEARLGRRLAPGDFNEAPCNDPTAAGPRLRNRLRRGVPTDLK